MTSIVEQSIKNISEYAKSIGADYEFIRGIVFKPKIAHKLDIPCQKLVYLDEKYDEYDNVLMLDADMFAVKGLTKNVFEETTGIGKHESIQTALRQKLVNLIGSEWGDTSAPYWGGEFMMLSKEIRKSFREVLDDDVCLTFARHYHDEGIMHGLSKRLGMKDDPSLYLGSKEWCWSSWEPDVENASFIHIRRKMWTDGPKQDKILNWKDLVDKGILPS